MSITSLRASAIEAIGILVSYVGSHEQIVLGYLLPRSCWKNENASKIVYRSGGNGFYYPELVNEAIEDNGAFYRNAIKKMFGGK